MDPEFAASANLMNQLIAEIQKKALTLGEGENVNINLEVQLYRRQEESKQTATVESMLDRSRRYFPHTACAHLRILANRYASYSFGRAQRGNAMRISSSFDHEQG